MEATVTGKAIVLGWDGATFDIIRPLVDQGRMPNTARLMEKGAYARLASTIPAVTPVAWTTMTTGVNPGKHGIFDGHQFDPETGRVRFASAAMRRVPPLWSLISGHGGECAVLNVPVTYPPDRINGFMAPGMFTPPGAPDAVFPADMGREFLDRFGPLADSPPKYADPARYLESLLAGVRLRRDMTLWLIERRPFDLVFSVFMESDRAQHFFWKYRDPAHPRHAELGRAIERVYEALDEALGTILEAAGPGTTAALVSDHGAGPLHTGVFLNAWLMRQGYLFLTRDLAETFSRPSPLHRGVVRRALGKAVFALAPAAGAAMKAKALGAEQDRANNLLRSIIDRKRSLAWSDGMGGGVYLNPETAGDRTALCDRLADGLLKLRDPRSGAPAIAAVQRREDIYHGPWVGLAPDLVTTCAPGYQVFAPHEFLINAKAPSLDIFLDHPWSGRHETYGVFALAGPGVRGGDVGECEMADVTPTLLALLGVPLPPDLDGRPLDRALARALARPLTTAMPEAADGPMPGSVPGDGAAPLSPEDEAALKDQLENLGYM